jgi:hypothetical protein
VFIAVLGTPRGPLAVLSAYRLEWFVVAGSAALAALAGLAVLSRRALSPAPSPVPGQGSGRPAAQRSPDRLLAPRT